MSVVLAYPTLDTPTSLSVSSFDMQHSDSLAGPWDYPPHTLSYGDPYMPAYTTSTDDVADFGVPATTSIAQVAPAAALPSSNQGSPYSNYGRSTPASTARTQQVLPPLHILPPQFHGRPMSHLENRPKSSPSTFGPSAESIVWPDSKNAFPLQYSTDAQSSSMTTNFSPPQAGLMLQNVGGQVYASPPPELKQPQPKRHLPALAPSRTASGSKRSMSDDEDSHDASGKRQKRTMSVVAAELNEDDRLLVSLKEEENLPWKDIAARFSAAHGRTFQVAALQMRYKRLREKFRTWQNEDVEALRLAHEYWENYKWDIISSKMLDFGVNERWPAKHCARKWSKLNPRPHPQPMDNGMMPGHMQPFPPHPHHHMQPPPPPQEYGFMPV